MSCLLLSQHIESGQRWDFPIGIHVVAGYFFGAATTGLIFRWYAGYTRRKLEEKHARLMADQQSHNRALAQLLEQERDKNVLVHKEKSKIHQDLINKELLLEQSCRLKKCCELQNETLRKDIQSMHPLVQVLGVLAPIFDYRINDAYKIVDKNNSECSPEAIPNAIKEIMKERDELMIGCLTTTQKAQSLWLSPY